MRLSAALVLAFALAVVGAAPATASNVTGDAADDVAPLLADFAVPLPDTFAVHRAGCPDIGGACATGPNLYLDGSVDHGFALGHEVGHVYLNSLDGYWKGRLMVRLGFDPLRQSWHNGTGQECGNGDCPSEVSADAYAACALRMTPPRRRHGSVSGSWESAYGYNPSRRKHRRVCRVLRASGR